MDSDSSSKCLKGKYMMAYYETIILDFEHWNITTSLKN